MEFVIGLFHIMDEKKAFGELHSKKFVVGDIVEWSSWDDVKESWLHNYGVITEIKNEMRHNRLVSVSRVLPVNSNLEIEHFTMSLRIVSKKRNLEVDS